MFEWIVYLILVIARLCELQIIPTITQGSISADEFRLIGGSSPNEGRLQVKHAGVPDGSWSTICSDDVDATIAFALCARMGHNIACDFGIAAELDTTNPNTDFGPIEKVTFADCIGPRVPYELDCTLLGFTGSTCTHSQDVWLRCTSDPGDLELHLASPISWFTGTLEARCIGSQKWSSVCAGDLWETRDAESACRHLGFSFAIETKNIYVSSLDPLDIPDRVIISEVGCFGNETNLMECGLGLVRSTCSTIPRISCGRETSEFGSRVGLCGINDLCGTECAQTIGSNARIGCHCDELCQALGDCCYDYQMNCNPEGLPPPTSLKGLPVGWYQCIALPSLYGKFVGYYLINVCPESWLENGIRDLCKTPVNREDIIGSLPVYNNDTLHHYRNIYCAICNGESYKSMVPWSVHAAYVRGSNSYVPNFNDTEIPGLFTGDFTVQVPDNMKGEVRSCSAPTVDTCLDEFSGSQTEQGCLSYVGPLAYRPVFGSTITNYRNPYCAMCNNFTLTLRESCDYFLCKVECDVTDPWSRCFELCEGFTNILTLDLLFNFKSDNTLGDNTVVSCSIGEIFDPFVSSCRVLNCASGFDIQGNECIERTMPSTSAPVPDQEFAFNPNNTVNVGLLDCLMLFLGENTHGIVYWDATLNNSSKVGLLTVNFLAGNETVVDNIHSVISSYESSICNISQFVLFLELKSILPAQTCKNHNASGLDPFHGYVIRNNVFRIQQFDYNFKSSYYDIYGIDNACLNSNLRCTSFVTLNSTEFVQLTEGNQTVLKYIPSGLSIPYDAYVLLADGSAVICADYLITPQPPNAAALALVYLSYIFYSLSVIALAVTFIIYSILPPLRNLAGLAIMNLVGALFVANILLLLSGQLLDVPTLCLIAAPITHFTWLAAFMWMAVLSFNVTRTLSSKVVNKTHQSTTKPLLLYMLFAWGVPLVIVAICLALHFCQCTSAGPIYVDQTRCYIVDSFVNLYAFGIPVAMTLALSICLFVYTVVFLRRSRSSTRIARNETRLQEAKVELVVYFKLSVLMGVCWILGFLIQIIDGYAVIFIFVILNSLQGVLIFLSFCFTKRVRNLLVEHYGGSKKQHQTRRRKTNRIGESAASGTQTQSNTDPSVNTDTTRL